VAGCGVARIKKEEKEEEAVEGRGVSGDSEGASGVRGEEEKKRGVAEREGGIAILYLDATVVTVYIHVSRYHYLRKR